ncbi:hypothetical protein HKD37_13G036369 [Glycine soja]
MAESTRSKSNMDRIEEAIAKLASNQLSLPTKLDDYHATSKHGRVTIASFYMEGPALAWFQWMARLAPDICWEVQVLQPLTLVQSAALARLQEEKLSDPRWVFRYRPHLPTFSGPLSIRPPNLAASTPLLPSPPKPASVPLKRLSP